MANNKVQLADGTVLMDTTGVTVTEDTLLSGYTALDRSGATITGTVVTAPASSTTPAMDGTADAGSEDAYARGDHVHPTDTSRQAKITASGILKGDGSGGVSAATAGTDYVAAETDPTVPSWAKAASKPTYTASEVGAAEASHDHDAGDITSGTLAVGRGGTGQTSAVNAANAFANALTTGSSAPVDADYYIAQYAGGGTSTTTYHRRPHSALWTYIKGKADALYAAISHSHAAGDITSGTLPVNRGGTGAASFTANRAIISGSTTTGAFTTRAITNNTSATSAITGSTNLLTMNTLKNALNRATGVAAADTGYTTYMARGTALVSSETTPTNNGQIAWVYE